MDYDLRTKPKKKKKKRKKSTEQLTTLSGDFRTKEQRASCPLGSGSVHLWSALDFLGQDAALSGLRSGCMTAMAKPSLGPAYTAQPLTDCRVGAALRGFLGRNAEVFLGLAARFL